MADAEIRARIEEARGRTLEWLAGMQAPLEKAGVMRASEFHDAALWPGMLLPASAHGILCLDLLGGLGRLSPAERARLAGWFEQWRTPDGRFLIEGLRESQLSDRPDREQSRRRVEFQVTNLAIGAVEALEPDLAPNLDFARFWLEPGNLVAWLAARDFADPRGEGAFIAHLASFLDAMRRHNLAAPGQVAQAIGEIATWLAARQDRATGFWGVRQGAGETALMQAFAGAARLLPLFEEAGEPIPHAEQALDYVLALPTALHSAEIDYLRADVAGRAHGADGGRREAIEAWGRAMLAELLDFQNEDGGFADQLEGTWRLDGWADGYAEPQGLSNTFATHLRWLAIALIADMLWPGRWTWNFRRMLGTGCRRS